jgi:methylated-DNA-protein-cysteine methyltransferase-like protein
MVGWAMNANHTSKEFVPAHRVVNHIGLSDRQISFLNSSTMQQLLENEGLVVEDDRILNFREKFWDPSV